MKGLAGHGKGSAFNWGDWSWLNGEAFGGLGTAKHGHSGGGFDLSGSLARSGGDSLLGGHAFLGHHSGGGATNSGLGLGVHGWQVTTPGGGKSTFPGADALIGHQSDGKGNSTSGVALDGGLW